MSLEKNKAIIRSLIEAFNKQNLATLDELIAPDYVDLTSQLRGREGFKRDEINFFKGFPDFHMAIEDIIAENDKVWVRLKVTGTHTGELEFGKMRLTPTGKKITAAAVSIWRIVDDKVAERESVYDFLDFLTQLEVVEYTEKAKHSRYYSF